jgi:propionyl-CoA synthetase
MQTVWRDDERFVNTYWKSIPGKLVYSTFDWGIRDEDGYFFILGRTDDVINVAGHRLGTREIEESISSHPNVAEVAVVGVADQLKGQVAMAFAVLKDASALVDDAARKLEGRDHEGGGRAAGRGGRPARVRFVTVLPKTRSGKLLRRAIQAVCEGRDPGDLTTMEDPTALQQIPNARVVAYRNAQGKLDEQTSFAATSTVCPWPVAQGLGFRRRSRQLSSWRWRPIASAWRTCSTP